MKFEMNSSYGRSREVLSLVKQESAAAINAEKASQVFGLIVEG